MIEPSLPPPAPPAPSSPLEDWPASAAEVIEAINAGRHALVAATAVADVMFAEATAVMGDVGWKFEGNDRTEEVREAFLRVVVTGPSVKLTWSLDDLPVAELVYHGPGDEWRVTTPGDGPHGAKFEIHPAGTVCRRATTAREVCLAVAATPLFAHAMARARSKNAARLAEEARARCCREYCRARSERRDAILLAVFCVALAAVAGLGFFLP